MIYTFNLRERYIATMTHLEIHTASWALHINSDATIIMAWWGHHKKYRLLTAPSHMPHHHKVY